MKKSYITSTLLSLFFGPFGVLYSNIGMFVATFALTALAREMIKRSIPIQDLNLAFYWLANSWAGFLVIVWVLSLVIAPFCVAMYNEKIDQERTNTINQAREALREELNV